MDTNKLIDAIAMADRVDFDELLNQAMQKAGQLAADYLQLATIDAILKHSSRGAFGVMSEAVLIKVQDMLDQAKEEMENLYPEVKDLL